MDISHEEFITILKEKEKYEKMKDNLTSENEKSHEIMRLSSTCQRQCQIKDLKNKNKKNKK